MILPLFIITTSDTKFSHISYLCSLNNVELVRLPYEYPEIQDNDMAKLLTFSLENTFFPEKDKVFFIIEQTSVFLRAFPKEGPGFFFKDWWKNTNKTELKSLASKDPRAAIESGIALNIPEHPPIVFTNKQHGKISLEGYRLRENEKYPWLSSDDFNLYFIPSGATRVYNAMPVSETLRYDFRKPNVDKVCQRLEEYYSILSRNMSLQDIVSVAESFRGPINKTHQKRLDSKEWKK